MGVVTILASLSVCASSLGVRGGRFVAAFQPPSLLATTASVVGGAKTAAASFRGSRSSVISALRQPLFGHRLPARLRLKGGSSLAKGAASVVAMSASATAAAPVEKFRKDYTPQGHVISNVDLTFKIGEESTQVISKMVVKTNPKGDASQPMRLDAEALKLNTISLNGKALTAGTEYEWDGDDVIVLKAPLPAEFTLETDVTIRPQDNTQLSGLYKSGMYCTQCEAEGFRRITPFQDRPDVMAMYKVRFPTPPKLPGGSLTGFAFDRFALKPPRQPLLCSSATETASPRGILATACTTPSGRTPSQSPRTSSLSSLGTSGRFMTPTRPRAGVRLLLGSSRSTRMLTSWTGRCSLSRTR